MNQRWKDILLSFAPGGDLELTGFIIPIKYLQNLTNFYLFLQDKWISRRLDSDKVLNILNMEFGLIRRALAIHV